MSSQKERNLTFPAPKWVERQLSFGQTHEERKKRLLDILEPHLEQVSVQRFTDEEGPVTITFDSFCMITLIVRGKYWNFSTKPY
jgi:hypothetical protein